MKITKSRLLLGIVVVVFAAGLVYAFRPQPVPVEITRATRGSLQVTVNNQGRTRIRERYVVSAPLSGRLLRVELHPGDVLEAGETVLTAIEPSDSALLDPRSRAEAEARMRAAEAAQGRAVPAVERSQAEAELAHVELERAKQLAAAGALSARELDQAQLRARTAADNLKEAEYSLRIAEFELEQARAVLNGSTVTGSDASMRFEIRSPVSGQLLRVFQESAAVVSAGTRLLEIGDREDLELEIDVLSTDAVKINPGDRVIVDHWGGDTPLEARVRLIEPAAFLKISALGVEEQRVYVIADFVDPLEKRRSLGDAFRVEARIIIDEVPDALKVPIGSLFREAGEWAVFTVQRGRAKIQQVQIGRRNEEEAEITSGLGEGAAVIVHPSDRVRDGVRVRVRVR